MCEGNTSSRFAIVFLTGSTGFLGGFVARSLQADPSVAKIYCPIRNKKGLLGPERLKACLGSLSKCIFVGIDDAVPQDTTHVILNAYNTRFDQSLLTKLEENVAPILRTLHDCKRLQSTIRGITFVSTAFVLPPLPFRGPKKGRLPFMLDPHSDVTATQVYEAITSRDPSGKELLSNLCPYYQRNSYAFSKHIIEHMLSEQFAELPVCIVRPSIISPSMDLKYGFDSNAALPLVFKLAPHYVMMAPNCAGLVNFVLIEDATRDIMEGAFKLSCQAKPAGSGSNRHDRKKLWHPIVQSVSHSNVNAYTMFREIAPHVPRIDIRNDVLRRSVRSVEFFVVRLLYGQKVAQLLRIIYESYDYFLGNTWDFEPKYAENVWQVILDTGRAYLKIKACEGDASADVKMEAAMRIPKFAKICWAMLLAATISLAFSTLAQMI